MDTRELLLKFSSVDGNSGDEKLAAKEAVELLSEYGKTYIDNLGSVICEVAPKKNGRHVMLDAHLDQIALLVINIEENGFLRTIPAAESTAEEFTEPKSAFSEKKGNIPA